MKNHELFMTVDEQKDALLRAGFADVSCVRLDRGLVLHRALVAGA
jgi:hypothetical protein